MIQIMITKTLEEIMHWLEREKIASMVGGIYGENRRYSIFNPAVSSRVLLTDKKQQILKDKVTFLPAKK